MEANKRQKRLTVWAVFLIIVGFISAMVLPESSMSHFFDLLKDIISNLII